MRYAAALSSRFQLLAAHASGSKFPTDDTFGGRVILQDGAAQTMADLTVAKPNQRTAKLAAPVKPGTKLVVSIKLADGHDVKARFVEK